MMLKYYVVIYLVSVIISEVCLLDVEMVDVELFVFLLCCKDYEYSFDYYQYWFYLCFNCNGKNFGLYCICMCDE